MGCWDIFCCVCGNTCHTPLEGTYYQENKKGITESQCDDVMSGVDTYLDNCSIILKNGNVIHNCYNENGNDFSDENYESYESITNEFFAHFNDDDHHGIFVHRDCYNFVKTKYDVELKYSHIPLLQNKDNEFRINVDYGEIEKYWHQDFDFFKMMIDDNMYMTSNPFHNSEKNTQRINKIVEQFNISKEPAIVPEKKKRVYKKKVVEDVIGPDGEVIATEKKKRVYKKKVVEDVIGPDGEVIATEKKKRAYKKKVVVE
jgi:hypothetical protein